MKEKNKKGEKTENVQNQKKNNKKQEFNVDDILIKILESRK
jgi:hypothetical protein